MGIHNILYLDVIGGSIVTFEPQSVSSGFKHLSKRILPMKFSRFASFLLTVLAVCTFFFAPVAMAQDMPAVVKPEGICTRDYNQCANPSICSCPDGYKYNASVGYCLIENIDNATSSGFDVRSVKSSCSIQAQALPTTCTKDVNPLGYPSKCICPGSSVYNQLFAHCVIPLS